MSTTTSTYRYELEKGSETFRCPRCHKKELVRFIDNKTGDYLPEKYGRCNREIKCEYFINPYEDKYYSENGTDWREDDYQPPEPPPIDYVPYEVFSASLKAYTQNSFSRYLRTLFSDKTATSLIKKYKIGSSKHWQGSTVFWQVDVQGNIRSGKVMLYDATGHRVKQPFNHIHWVHALLYDEFNLSQCLFGEHLLTDDKTVPVAIVESEKTAIISSVYFPEFIWLAAGALNNLKPDRCDVLMGRRVTLFPDLGAFDKWQAKANDISYFCDVNVSDLLESHAGANDKQEGYDLADYLTDFSIDNFLQPAKTNHTKPLKNKDNGSQTKYETKKINNNRNQPNKIKMPIAEFNRRFNSYPAAPF